MCNILDFQTDKELSIVQFSTKQKNTFDYISLSTALTNDWLEIKEIDEEGEVNNLIVFNKSENYVFIMDGDILEGAKQNRVLNTSVFLAPGSKTILPVSCIEQGRWDSVSEKFNNSDYILHSYLRMEKTKSVNKNLHVSRRFQSNQNAMWQGIREYNSSQGIFSKTSNLSDAYKNKADDLNEFLKSFKLNTYANGIAIFTRKNLLSIDVFNRTDIYRKYFSKLLKSVAAEVYYLKHENNNITSHEASENVLNFFKQLKNIEKNEFDSVGVGIEERFKSEEYTGFSLNYKNHVIHLAGLKL